MDPRSTDTPASDTPNTDNPESLPSGTWMLDPSRTTITVTARKLGFITVPATLSVSSGTIEIDADHQVGSVEVVARAASYTSGSNRRNEHIRSADFLDSEQHPDLVFRAGRLVSRDTGYRAEGSVVVKGKTFPLTVDIRDVGFGTGRGSFTATATIDRNAIGVGKLPSFVIGRNLQLTVVARALITGT